MKELWEYLKGFFIISGLFGFSLFVLVIFAAVLGGISDASLPKWSGNIIDDLLYFAYNSEKFGFMAVIWRFFVIYAVVATTYQLAKNSWGLISKKIAAHKLKNNQS